VERTIRVIQDGASQSATLSAGGTYDGNNLFFCHSESSFLLLLFWSVFFDVWHFLSLWRLAGMKHNPINVGWNIQEMV
jgi:hypothetical protein